MWNFLVGLKAKAIGLAVFLIAIASELVWQRHKGLVEGRQIAAGKSIQAVEVARQTAADEQEKAARLPAGEARKELDKNWSRD